MLRGKGSSKLETTQMSISNEIIWVYSEVGYCTAMKMDELQHTTPQINYKNITLSGKNQIYMILFMENLKYQYLGIHSDYHS